MRKLVGERPLGRQEMEYSDNIDLREIVCEDVRWIKLAEDRFKCRVLILVVLKLGVLLPQC
jgi:hypothetical protein